MPEINPDSLFEEIMLRQGMPKPAEENSEVISVEDLLETVHAFLDNRWEIGSRLEYWLRLRSRDIFELNLVKPPKPKALEWRLKRDSKKRRRGREKVGLIFDGAMDGTLVDEAAMAYLTLSGEGFDELYVLDNHPLSVFGIPVDDIATRESFGMIMDYLSGRLREGDTLFCFFGGHYSRRDFLRDPALPVWGYSERDYDFILARELKQYLDCVDATKTLLFPGCFGARFASRFGEGSTIAVSASSGNGDSYGPEFAIYFFKALYDKSGDWDGDGRVSVGDAFWYAAMKDPHVVYKGMQEPQIFYGDINPMNTYLDI